MNRRKSRAITNLSGVPTGVMPLSSPSSPSVASDATIQASLTINQPNNIQLASVTGFINGINGNITNCKFTTSTTQGTYSINSSGNESYFSINMYNIAVTLMSYNKQLNSSYNVSATKSLASNDISYQITQYYNTKLTINITSNNPDNTTSSTMGMITLDVISDAEYILWSIIGKAPLNYNNIIPADGSKIANLLNNTIIPLSIINSLCIGLDTFLRDLIMFGPLVSGKDNTTLAVMFYSQQKLINYINNICTNIPASNPQLASTVVATAANNTTTLQSQISTLTQSQSLLTQQLQASQASISDITNKYNDTASQLKQVQNQLAQTQSNDTSTINSLTSQTQSLQTQMNKLNGLIDSETNLYNTTKDNLDTANSQISSLQSQLKDEAKLLDSLNSKLASDTKYIKELYILLVILVIIIAVLVVKYIKRKGGSSSRINGGGLYSYNNNNWYNFM